MKRLLHLFFIAICMLGLTACSVEEENAENMYQIYCVSNSETKVEAHEQQLQSVTEEEKLQELIACLSTMPEKLEYKPPFAMGFELLDYEIEDSKLLLNVSKEYKDMPATTEVLVRAAIVRTLTQVSNIQYVGITVEEEQLFDNTGSLVGWMSADQFINNDGNDINTYELARVKLYLANESGDKLIAAYREKHYSTNISLERFVVEELIAGPSGQVEGLYPSINPNTKIINVMTKDGICYVNLDSSFLTVVNNVSTEVSVYSIVNSLVELTNINKVQILVDGEVPKAFSKSIYERNLDIVTTIEKEQAREGTSGEKAAEETVTEEKVPEERVPDEQVRR